jgi:hypothetical protein
LVSRYLDINTLQIVDSRPFNFNRVSHFFICNGL